MRGVMSFQWISSVDPAGEEDPRRHQLIVGTAGAVSG